MAPADCPNYNAVTLGLCLLNGVHRRNVVTHQGHRFGIASKLGNILLNPFKRKPLVEQSEITLSLGNFVNKPGKSKHYKRNKSAAGHQHS